MGVARRRRSRRRTPGRAAGGEWGAGTGGAARRLPPACAWAGSRGPCAPGHKTLAIIPVALLVGGIGASGGLLQRSFQLPDATVNVLQGILFVVILASATFSGRLTALLERRKQAPPAVAPAPAEEVA